MRTTREASRSSRQALALLPVLLCLSTAAWAAEEVPTIPVDRGDAEMDLAELSLNELMNIEVVSVSRQAEPLKAAAAAVFVVTGEEIRRSGARTIAEALRLVPGLQVRRSSAQGYTVTSRGFAADKLEVLLDGRSVYTPLTSTVFWETLDTYLPDIDRIEVIRGPGATLWGANAVNGVINIVTRDARDTPGTQVLGGGGNEELAFGAVRTTSEVGDGGAVRLFAQGHERGRSIDENGDDNDDGHNVLRAGFRYDGSTGERSALTVTGDVFDERARNRESSGGFVQGAWSHRTDSDSQWSAEGSYTRSKLFLPGIFDETRDTGELGLQHQVHLGDRHNLVWGAGARVSHDETGGPPLFIIFDPQNRTLSKVNVYAQDQIRLGEGGELTLGSKFEHNNLTGFEFQPGIRLGWKLGESFFTWGSVSRAVRTPNRFDSDIAVFCQDPNQTDPPCTSGETSRVGNPDLRSESLIAYEWGVRAWTGNFSAELATFFNDYTDLRTIEPGNPPFGDFGNGMEARSYGGEFDLNWHAADWLDIQAFYGLVKINATPKSDSEDMSTESSLENGSPQQSAGLRAAFSPHSRFTVDSFLRYVDRIPSAGVDEYIELRVRTAWNVTPSLELALVGDNALNPHHPESSPGTQLERSVFLEALWTLP